MYSGYPVECWPLKELIIDGLIPVSYTHLMQEFMGLSHTQIGTAMSVAGLISTFGFLISIYLTDRVSKKVMIPMSLMGIGLLGIGLSTFPPYWLFLLINCGLAVCADMLYWPTMLKTVRLLGSEEEQGLSLIHIYIQQLIGIHVADVDITLVGIHHKAEILKFLPVEPLLLLFFSHHPVLSLIHI